MKSDELVAKAVSLARDRLTTYMWGGLGNPLNDANLGAFLKDYPGINERYVAAARRYSGQEAFLFDCVGLIKTLIWGWSGDTSEYRGGAVYGSNGLTDMSADQMIDASEAVSSDFTHIQPGEAVWLPGHIGIYIGDAQVVEATPAFANGVQITNLANAGSAVYPCRTWEKHGKIPTIEYGDPIEAEIAALPSWATGVVRKLYDAEILQGVGGTLDLDHLSGLRLLVLLDRAHVFDNL